MYDSTTTVSVGLDVHARSIRLAAVRFDELLEERTLPYDGEQVERYDEIAHREVGEHSPSGPPASSCHQDGGLGCPVVPALIGGIGVISCLVGVVWLGQGIGVIHGSFMTGETSWAVTGAILIVIGCGLLAWVARRSL